MEDIMKDYNLGIEKLGIEELDNNNAAKIILELSQRDSE